MTPGELQYWRKQILQVAGAHGAFNIRVFGSVAPGRADEPSDVDLRLKLATDAVR